MGVDRVVMGCRSKKGHPEASDYKVKDICFKGKYGVSMAKRCAPEAKPLIFRCKKVVVRRQGVQGVGRNGLPASGLVCSRRLDRLL